MREEELKKKRREIHASIPLTTFNGKIRIKQGNIFSEYGRQITTSTTNFQEDFYVEWQIGHDVETNNEKRLQNTTLQNLTFTAANGKTKALYELSEYIKYFYDWKIINQKELKDIKTFLSELKEKDFLISKRGITRKQTPKTTKINGFTFTKSTDQYPVWIFEFDNTNIVAEIKIREQQRGSSVQPMLYLCFPVTMLSVVNNPTLINRTATRNECASFIINKSNITVFLQTMKLLGTLSQNHNKDILSIIDVILMVRHMKSKEIKK